MSTAAPAPVAPGPAPIEVGTSLVEGTLRYWKANQAVTKGELLLASQISSMGRLITAATSILGWSVTISLALTGAIASALAPAISAPGNSLLSSVLSHLLWPAIVAEVLLSFAAMCCIRVLCPGTWRAPGHDPALVLNAPYGTELEVTESMASGYAEAAECNSSALDRLELSLRGLGVLRGGANYRAHRLRHLFGHDHRGRPAG